VWKDAGVHQNLAFAVHADPISGQHCWHQKVRLEKAGPGDRYGDVFVDTEKAFRVYRAWLEKTRPAPGPGGLRRPLWLTRAVKPAPEAYRMPQADRISKKSRPGDRDTRELAQPYHR